MRRLYLKFFTTLISGFCTYAQASANTHVVSCFGAIKTAGYTHDDEAKKLLVKASEFASTVMAPRGLRINLLREFLPTNKRLLGVNHNRGDVVKIRLRPAQDVSGRYF